MAIKQSKHSLSLPFFYDKKKKNLTAIVWWITVKYAPEIETEVKQPWFLAWFGLVWHWFVYAILVPNSKLFCDTFSQQ